MLVSGKVSKVGKMKKFLLACFGLGFALGGSYYMYRRWQNSREESDDADDQNDSSTTQERAPSFEPVKITLPSISDGDSSGKQDKAKSIKNTKSTKNNFGGMRSGFLL